MRPLPLHARRPVRRGLSVEIGDFFFPEESYLCIIGVWRSWLAHLVWDQRVVCSSHITPTSFWDSVEIGLEGEGEVAVEAVGAVREFEQGVVEAQDYQIVMALFYVDMSAIQSCIIT